MIFNFNFLVLRIRIHYAKLSNPDPWLLRILVAKIKQNIKKLKALKYNIQAKKTKEMPLKLPC